MKLAEKFKKPVITLLDTPVHFQDWKQKSADKRRR